MQAHRLVATLAACLISTSVVAADLVQLPAQPEGQPWPTDVWPERNSDAAAETPLSVQVAKAFAPDAPKALQGIRAVLVIAGGEIQAERYDEGFAADSKLVSWSVAKSLTHALAGIMVRDGRIALDSPLPVPEWQLVDNDPRRHITLDNALRMSTGLKFSEDYVDIPNSDVVTMLFGDGYADMGHYAADKPLIHAPGEHWSYSSGTTNLLSRVLRDLSGQGEKGTEDSYRDFMQAKLFAPLGMRNVEPEFDGAGTLIGSSLIFMTARDYARFGLLYMRGGVWDGRRILPEGWVDHARTETPASKGRYGAHWWLDGYADPPQVANAKIAFPPDTFMARGHEEQSIIIVPSKDVIVVCLSLVIEPDLSDMRDYLAGIVALFPDR